ncbi:MULTISPECIES: DeoR/GlpR family DNA-binding transcription regulator [Saccharibacillus]|uniref:DeoR/GlpR family DNA-binding transcription regulator n=1 Tax=Saccharibacillus TaxID=456492 RepID=UPI001238E2B9|nr:DeoR/GlpR family DNA-binding transcription regulator [Saccharibacillus sp. WB 17]MWJ31246.1 DeoR family transcriptional regulator [Saccharibacillus sp. WB 17]
MKVRRLQEIEHYIHTRKNVTLDELCLIFDVSKNTIRRDINQILQSGSIEKVYGGVVSVTELIPFENRNVEYRDQKADIGRLAAAYVEDHDLIFIDSGTTTCTMIEFLDPDKPLTILTNSLDVINGAAGMPNVDLLVLGSTYKRKTRSFVGVDDARTLAKYNVNKAFLSATGVSLAHGLTNSDLLEHEIKKSIASRAQQRILLADPSKFGRSTLLTYAAFSDLDVLVTSEGLPDEYAEACRSHGIALRRA